MLTQQSRLEPDTIQHTTLRRQSDYKGPNNTLHTSPISALQCNKSTIIKFTFSPPFTGSRHEVMSVIRGVISPEIWRGVLIPWQKILTSHYRALGSFCLSAEAVTEILLPRTPLMQRLWSVINQLEPTNVMFSPSERTALVDSVTHKNHRAPPILGYL